LKLRPLDYELTSRSLPGAGALIRAGQGRRDRPRCCKPSRLFAPISHGSVSRRDGGLTSIQAAMQAEHGLQCGYYTPGFVVSIHAFLAHHPDPADRRDPRRIVREPLPLHGLLRHHRRDEAGGGGGHGGVVVTAGRFMGQAVARSEDPLLSPDTAATLPTWWCRARRMPRSCAAT
jgi:[2Fe-2S] binding domain